jgi:hypothetical protein
MTHHMLSQEAADYFDVPKKIYDTDEILSVIVAHVNRRDDWKEEIIRIWDRFVPCQKRQAGSVVPTYDTKREWFVTDCQCIEDLRLHMIMLGPYPFTQQSKSISRIG